jgi:hypothetical protein
MRANQPARREASCTAPNSMFRASVGCIVCVPRSGDCPRLGPTNVDRVMWPGFALRELQGLVDRVQVAQYVADSLP